MKYRIRYSVNIWNDIVWWVDRGIETRYWFFGWYKNISWERVGFTHKTKEAAQEFVEKLKEADENH